MLTMELFSLVSGYTSCELKFHKKSSQQFFFFFVSSSFTGIEDLLSRRGMPGTKENKQTATPGER
jgi:hypothetical protein